MNTPLLTFIIVLALIVGGGMVKKACKTSHHAWCVPTGTWHHTRKLPPLYDLKVAGCRPCNEARRIAANIAKLPELVRK